MAIAQVVTRGYGNGTYNGSVSEVVTRGYDIAEQAIPDNPYGSIGLPSNQVQARSIARPITRIDKCNY